MNTLKVLQRRTPLLLEDLQAHMAQHQLQMATDHHRFK